MKDELSLPPISSPSSSPPVKFLDSSEIIEEPEKEKVEESGLVDFKLHTTYLLKHKEVNKHKISITFWNISTDVPFKVKETHFQSKSLHYSKVTLCMTLGLREMAVISPWFTKRNEKLNTSRQKKRGSST